MSPIRLFISSVQKEFVSERAALAKTVRSSFHSIDLTFRN